MPLHLDYRPQALDEFYGNENVVKALDDLLKRKDDIPHTFLFTGPSGTGKTTLARIIKEEIKCSDIDFNEMDASTDRGINNIRELKEYSNYPPLAGDSKIYFLDECHGISVDGQEAMLKMLEEPPKHVYFILCTTDPKKLKITFKRRCHDFELHPLDRSEMDDLLQNICDNEDSKIDSTVLTKIRKVSDGSPGVAVKLLDKVINMKGTAAEMIGVVEGTTYSESQVIDICRAMVDRNVKWKYLAGLLKDFKGDAESARYAIKAYMGKVLLNKGDARTAEILEPFVANTFMYSGKEGLILACYYAING